MTIIGYSLLVALALLIALTALRLHDEKRAKEAQKK
jgi:hypothetical protein